MSECKVESHSAGAGFEELVEAMDDDRYWVRFFARPCCPAPDLEGAANMLDRLAGEVRARADFSAEEQETLCALIGNRKEWYAESGLCRTSRG